MKNKSGILIEACVTNYRLAKRAESEGANIVEICENLAEGGTTPSAGTITRLAEELSIPLFVLIRPRSGDFVYSSGEFSIMKHDVEQCKKAGATGISIGILTQDMRVDEKRVAELVELASPMQISFNTAFDQTLDLTESVETLCKLKVNRILTSGGYGCASDNLNVIRGLAERAAGRVNIVICGGININNYEYLARQAGVNTVHGAGIL